MSEKAEKAKPWTDTEKMGLVFQILEKFGTIPWDDITLPEGRTKKACVVMIDKEKQKVKKARGEGSEAGATPKKRKAEGEATPKKASPKKKATKWDQKAVSADDDEAGSEVKATPEVKAEEEGDDVA
ncbi:uncharacterized protein LTR77_006297 [Saxophila tyrrhenica]|uniref:Myb-like domain-containing protein n=1 Tax=Saxophila tyrrhenica TaxID=1690608 RepID=A0AAV9P7Z5_9PEZI|nr:hypothetical protein LTR77_006297 [Saxophila tyrrhenica]